MEAIDGKHIESLLGVLYKTTKKHGAVKIINHLKSLEDGEKQQVKLQRKIINTVCKIYGVNSSSFKRPLVSGTVQDARTMCIVFLKDELNLTHEEIALIFGKNYHTVVSRAISEHNNRNPELIPDKEYCQNYVLAQEKIQSYKEEKHNS